MGELWQGIIRALELIVTFDPEVMAITFRSLGISTSACLIATLICLPLGSLIHFTNFKGKNLLVSLIQTFYSLPTVLVGLLVFILFSRAGPFGNLNLMFTPALMIIGQSLLVMPLMLGLIISALVSLDKTVADTAFSLGASRFQAGLLSLKEARYAVITSVIMGFGRAISEVGLAMMVGGNIRGFTRILTTAISLETSKGDIELSLALGFILLLISLAINVILSQLQRVEKSAAR
ncbi:MAG: ABC transporter permease [Dehalococcoidales bacterium]|jgi:tungstate transport system permease protein|nr:ABC transporter permease [Dehalococcoidales bacterium]MDX9803836.1 ABC transporter permease [Dehalococcoidales bacterium]